MKVILALALFIAVSSAVSPPVRLAKEKMARIGKIYRYNSSEYIIVVVQMILLVTLMCPMQMLFLTVSLMEIGWDV